MSSLLSYRPRRPEQGALHQIVREHYETFRAQVADHRDGQGLPGGRGGAVVIVQRFGSALNLNVHLHAMVLDGVFARDVAIARRIQRLLGRRGIVDDSDGVDVNPFADDAPTLAGLAAASVRGGGTGDGG